MDTFIEQIIKKNRTGRDAVLKALICVGAVLVSVVMLFLPIVPVNFLFALGVVYGGYYLMTGFDCEYEYIVTNGEIDIDKIIAKRKRKRLITFKISAFESFGEYKDAPAPGNSVTTVLANGRDETGDDSRDYYADFKHGSLGSVRIIFTPNERVLEAMKPYLPRNIRNGMLRQQ